MTSYDTRRVGKQIAIRYLKFRTMDEVKWKIWQIVVRIQNWVTEVDPEARCHKLQHRDLDGLMVWANEMLMQ